MVFKMLKCKKKKKSKKKEKERKEEEEEEEDMFLCDVITSVLYGSFLS